jgi:hypothetical protein
VTQVISVIWNFRDAQLANRALTVSNRLHPGA